MSKCKKCEKLTSNTHFCNKCKKEKAGSKPRKSKALCSGCHDTFYENKYRETTGCWSYKGSKVVLDDHVYYSSNQLVPNVEWRLSCYHR